MAKKPLRFDMTNPRAERKIAKLSGEAITRITEDQKLAARETILAGFEKGRGPKEIALDLAGRVNRVTGNREGGILGMTSRQAEAARNLRDRLESNDPAEMRKVLDMNLRDRRYDNAILRGIEIAKEHRTAKPVRSTLEKHLGIELQPNKALTDEGAALWASRAAKKAAESEPAVDPVLSKDLIDKAYGKYVDNSLVLRGETVARTETGEAVNAAQNEAFAQGLEKTGYTTQSVTRTWRTAGDGRVRDSHAEMEGQQVSGLDEPFETGNGAQMLFPLDASLGAGPDDIANCRCDVEIEIDFSEGVE